MKVLLVGDFPPPNGGVATHVEELFRAVRARGGACAVLDVGKGQLPADGVIPAGSELRFAGLLASHAARGWQIHLHTPGNNAKSWLLIAACAAAGRGRSIVTLHSGLAPAWLREKPWRRALARLVLRGYAHVIAVNEEIREAIGFDGAEVLPAFSSEAVKPGAPPPDIPAASPLFCAMHVPRPEYGLPWLLEAFARVRRELPQAGLALYGTATERLHVDGVRGFGELARPQALALIAACNVFVRPTLADGDSVSVREALALGRPVVASEVGKRPPGVRLVPVGDAEALARAMIEAARAPVREVAAMPDSADRILSLYGWTPPPPVSREEPLRAAS